MLWLLLLIGGFVLLVKGASVLVDGASSLARSLGISELAVGLSVVAFGTSLPELFVNVSASIAGSNEITIGNITGSNIANIFLILGLSAAIYPMAVGRGTVLKEIPLSFLAAVLLGVLSWDVFINAGQVNILSRGDGVVFLLFFLIFIYYLVGIAKEQTDIGTQSQQKTLSTKQSAWYIITGLVFLAGGGEMVVHGAVGLARWAGLNSAFVAVTIVAIGTSLPELATSVTAAFKKNPEIAVGNVVGSNIFNIFFILGVSAVIRPVGVDSVLQSSIVMAIACSGVLFLFMFTGGRRLVDRWEGMVMVAAYVVYIIFLGKTTA